MTNPWCWTAEGMTMARITTGMPQQPEQVLTRSLPATHPDQSVQKAGASQPEEVEENIKRYIQNTTLVYLCKVYQTLPSRDSVIVALLAIKTAAASTGLVQQAILATRIT